MNALANFGRFVFCTALLIGGATAGIWEFGVLAGVLIFAGGLGVLWTIGDGLWGRHNDELDSRTSLVRARSAFATTMAATDHVTRQFLAQEWKELGVEFGEEHLVYVLKDGVNTGLLIPFLQAFLMDSTQESFVDVRNYNDEKYLQERMDCSREIVRLQWEKATKLLVAEVFLREGSMAGSRTYRWTSPEHYKKLRRRYLNLHGLPELE